MQNLDLNGQRILVFCPCFFGYETDIVRELKKLGAEVSHFDERVFNSTFGKALVRLNIRFMIKYFVDKFYQHNLIKKIYQVDCILLINPETITPKHLEICKKINPNLKIITYMWDSFRNKPYSKKYIKHTDSFFTFDPYDAELFNVKFLPLFYVDEYKRINDDKKIEYDFSFIGTAHSERYSLVTSITKNYDDSFLFFYCPSRLVFIFKKYFKNELRGLSLNDVSLFPMNRQSILDIVEKTQVVIDVNHPLQVGLTMRTIEMLGAKKKIISTNKHILKYDFYSPNNIFLYSDETDLQKVKEFLKVPFEDVDIEVYEKYSINSWVRTLFS